MKFKSTIQSIFCILLALIIVFPPITTSAKGDITSPIIKSNASANISFIYQPTLSFSQIVLPPTAPTPSTFQGILKGFASGVATRAVQEITCLLIAEDIPGLSKALVALQDPATRAELQHKQLVQEMAKSVAAIEASVARIETQLSDISNKIDNYATAEALRDSIQELNNIVSKYQALWGNYEAIISAGEKLSALESLYPAETRTSEQSMFITSAKNNLDIAVAMFINSVEEPGGFPFLSDLEKLPGYIWNPSDKNSDYDISYLGAYEAYLRERYPFEHQITEPLSEAIETVIDIQSQMLILYREYYTYKQLLDPTNTNYSVYTSEYFTRIQYGIITNIAAMIQSTDFENYIRPRAFTESELEEIKKLDSTFVEGENIFSQITLNEKTYKAYKIRDNKTKTYYKIISEAIPSTDLINKIYSDSTNGIDTGKYIYRPSFFIDNKYSDDGLYEIVNDTEQLNFLDGQKSILSFLRDSNGCNLKDIPQELTHLITFNDNFKSENLKDSYWDIPLVSLSDSKIVSTGSTKDIYNNSSVIPLIIYQETSSQTEYGENGVLTLNDKGLVENRTFVISDGKTLDISEITLDISNVTIILHKNGKIISNPNINLIDSAVYVCNTNYGDIVYINNLNVQAKDKSKSALTVKSSCTVAFEGENSFIGKSSEATRSSVYKYYNYNYPSLASHGILIEGKNTITSFAGTKDGYISYNALQKLTANGAGGGAGICHNGMNLTIKCLNLSATGSEISVETDLISSGEQLYTIGAGIGTSLSCVLTSSVSFNVQSDEKIITAGDINRNSTNYLSIENSIVSAKGVKSNRTVLTSTLCDEIYSEDIGGVIIDGLGYYCFRAGGIENSTITMKNDCISSRITTNGGNNLYTPETFKITTYTKGSNGVTTDGVYFKIYGDKGETEWMYAEDCGNEKGSWTGNIKGISVGKIQKAQVKTKSSNHWYPGKITITAQLGGETLTLWGGRWIGNTAQTLLPTDNIYEVTVNTGTSSNSGTDSGIYLTLKDKNNKYTSQIELSDIHQDKNAFEKDDQDTFPIYAPPEFDECTNAYFYSDYKNSAAGWHLASFEIKKVQGGTDGFVFTSGQWLEKEGTINFGKYSGQTGSFYLEIKTADKTNAGTDSDIWLTIHGSNGNTGEIHLGTYAGSSNNFERNDLDCFHVGYDSSIGNITSITIRKNNFGGGPDWDLDYIEITEEISDNQTPQSVRFTINSTIENTSYDFMSPTSIVKSAPSIDREILKNLSQNQDGSYTLPVNRTVTIREEIFEFLKENNIILTICMQNEGETIYSVTFNGKLINNQKSIVLKKGYSFADGNAIIDFISSALLPQGTKVSISAKALGFNDSDKLVLFEKDEFSQWKETITLENKDGFVEISLEQGKEILINKDGAPLPENGIPSPGDKGNFFFLVSAFLSIAFICLLIKRNRIKR